MNRRPRWKQFFTYLRSCHEKKHTPDWKIFDEQMKDWEWQWVNSHENYTDKPIGNAVMEAQAVFRKYEQRIKQIYNL